MVLFTHNTRKIEGTAYKNGDVDGKCKRTLSIVVWSIGCPLRNLVPCSVILND